MSALLLAFTLYLIARPLNSWIAQLGMYFRMGEAIVGAIGVAIAFAKFHLYTSEGSTETQALSSFFRHAGFAFYNISAIFFSFGSLLFFYIFYKSKAIPRILSVIGIIASPLVTLLCFTGLIYPEDSKWLQLGWAPMAIAEVGTGIWLMIYGIKYKDEQSLAS
jgi:magnesium-transporting ATPase (P-type)